MWTHGAPHTRRRVFSDSPLAPLRRSLEFVLATASVRSGPPCRTQRFGQQNAEYGSCRLLGTRLNPLRNPPSVAAFLFSLCCKFESLRDLRGDLAPFGTRLNQSGTLSNSRKPYAKPPLWRRTRCSIIILNKSPGGSRTGHRAACWPPPRAHLVLYAGAGPAGVGRRRCRNA